MHESVRDIQRGSPALLLFALLLPVSADGGTPATTGGCDLRALHDGASGLDPTARQAGADESWLQVVAAQLARDEYNATLTPEGIQAPNRAHNLRTQFRAGGIEVAPRHVGTPTSVWRFAWTTSHFGRPGVLRAVEAADPEQGGSRVSYRRADFDEWYENSPQGLEQGFTVHHPPPGRGPLCLAGRIDGFLSANLQTDGAAVDLLDADGSVALRYGELRVLDAGGNEVPARLALDGTELTIVVEDEGALYPLTIDPLLTSPAWSEGSDQDAAHFGCSVATGGDVNGDGFSDVIVGARGYDNGQFGEGSAFVYLGSASGLATTAAWSAEGNQDTAYFGTSVSTAGDVNGDGFSDVIVGALYYNDPEPDEGQAFVYYGSAEGLSTTPAWTAGSGQADAHFGNAVSTAGDVNGDGFSDVIVGADGWDNNEFAEGRAYVFHGSAGGLSTTPAWTVEGNQAEAAYGGSVAMAGDVNGDGFSDVIVGAARYDNGQSNEGRAYVYHGSAAGLATTAAWTAESNQANSWFGGSVATAGDVNGDGFSDVIVGAALYDFIQTDEGRAYVYHGSPSGLAATAAWTVESNQDLAYFGMSVAAAGDVNGDGFSDVIVGASGDSDSRGRAFAYHGSAEGLATASAWTVGGPQTGGQFGISVATAGDVNG
ncbi:MAG: integrin alpha, partial [Candidatus Eisenbacteria bacterium]|nr:integrin alpha [Candidatus Eisenbacteria bacterium]